MCSVKRVFVTLVVAGIPLFSSGCIGGGVAGLFNFFGAVETRDVFRGSSFLSDSTEFPHLLLQVIDLPALGGGSATDQLPVTTNSNEGDSAYLASQVARVHNPEPASLVLVGVGFSCLVVLARRRRYAPTETDA